MHEARTVPLTPAQELFLAGQARAQDAPIYNMGWRFDLFGALDPARFARAFASVADQHEGLALRITGGQQSAGPVPVLPPLIDLSGAANPQAAAQDLIAQDMAQPFDLAQSTWRSHLIRLTADHWVWTLCHHHIAGDAAAGEALFKAMAAAYEGKEPAPSAQFTDMAGKRSANASAQAHWSEAASGPVDRNAPFGSAARGSTGSEAVPLSLGPDRTTALDALAQSPDYRSLSAHLSRFAILMAIHAAWCHRLTENRRICVGVPAGLRQGPEELGTIGLFAETFPFFLEVEDHDSFRSLFLKARTQTQIWLKHAKPGGSTPVAAAVFPSVFNYLPTEFGAFAGLPVTAEFLHSGALEPGHDHQVTVSRFGGASTSIELQFRLKTEAYGEPFKDQALRHWLTLADAFLSDPDTPVGSVALGGAPLQGQAGPVHSTVLEAFAAQVHANPDALAIAESNRSLSYAGFDALVSAYAAGAQKAGVAPGDLVLIQARRSIETVAAIFGVLRAGGAFVPVASGTPQDRVQGLIQRHGIRTALRSPETERLEIDNRFEASDAGAEFTTVPREALAYVLFTSGSTGTPKGVMVNHDALGQYIGWNRQEFPGDHALATSIGFDASLTPLFTPLTSGACLRVYPETGHPDLALRQVIEEDRVDVANLTPSQFEIAFHGGQTVHRLKMLKFGGERLPTLMARDAAGRSASGIAIANEYGPTECVVGSTLHWFDPQSDTGSAVSIGRPGPDVELRVLDTAGNAVPPGLVGEVFIGGRTASGYLDQPALTAERFITLDGRPFYRTGDKARIDGAGRLHYLGRSDDQLKISGVRVDPGEVEGALKQLPGIQAAHVGPWPRDASTGQKTELAAWVCGDGEPDSWRAALRKSLPEEMVPGRFARVAEVPLLSSGKVDWAALPEPDVFRGATTDLSPPRPGLETTLAGLLQRELGLERIGRQDNFYDCGLDSLGAVRVAVAGAELGLGLQATDLFDFPSLTELAEALETRPVPAAPAPLGDMAPLIQLDVTQLDALSQALGDE